VLYGRHKPGGINWGSRTVALTDMRSTLFNRRRRELVISILLVAVMFHALIPAGFMPASGKLFSLTLCHGNVPAPTAPQDAGKHAGNSSHTQHCAFGNAPAAGPAMELARVLLTAVTASQPTVLFSEPLRTSVALVRVQQPRAPPRLA